MNYKKIYDSMIDRAKLRSLDKSKLEGYHETHHIVPKSVGGSNRKSNLVNLTGREHFIAHMLLWKIYPEDVSLMRAAFLMGNRTKDKKTNRDIQGKVSSKTYSKLKEEYSLAVRAQVSGEGNPFFGKKHSPEVLARIKKSKALWQSQQPKKEKVVKPKKVRTPEEIEATRIKRSKPRSPEAVQKCVEGFKKRNFQPWQMGIVTSCPLKLEMWACADLIHSFWELNNRTDAKFLNHLLRFFNNDLVVSKGMTEKFLSGWVPKDDPKWLDFHNTQKYTQVRESLKQVVKNKSVKQLREDFKLLWLDSRDSFRECLSEIIESNLNLFNRWELASVSKVSKVDVLEIKYLWDTNMISQKDLSDSFDVARNTISNIVSQDRYETVRELKEKYRDEVTFRFPDLVSVRLKIDHRNLYVN